MLPEDNSFNNILLDFDHPNPNINKIAYERMKKYFPDESLRWLIGNLDNHDVTLRRKSVKAISSFGELIVPKILELYSHTSKNTIKISCLKILVILGANDQLKNYQLQIQDLINSALEDNSVEIILVAISLLRQIGKVSLPHLKELCRDQNILKAKTWLM